MLAISGGQDSVALLRGMALLAPKRRARYEVTVVYVDHQQRSESAREGQSVVRWAEECGFQAAAIQLTEDMTNEAEMRNARYAALASYARTQTISTLLTAHHANDQLETFLMRACQGQPLGRLLMPSQRLVDDQQPMLRLVRPLLQVTRQQIETFVAELGCDWFEDASNPSTARGQLRSEVVPCMTRLWPQAIKQVASLAVEAPHVVVPSDWPFHMTLARLLPAVQLCDRLTAWAQAQGVPLAISQGAWRSQAVAWLHQPEGFANRQLDMGQGWILQVKEDLLCVRQH